MIRDFFVRLWGAQKRAAVEAERTALATARRDDVEGVKRRVARIDQLVEQMKQERRLGMD